METPGSAAPVVEEMLAGLFRIQVPLPGSPLKSVNSYVIPSPDRALVVDTGMLRPECEGPWLAGLEAAGVDLAKADVLLTHIHADHSGLAGVAAARGARILMGEREIAVLVEFESQEQFLETMERLGRGFGLSSEEVALAGRRHPGLRYSPRRYPEVEPVADGAVLRAGTYRFRAIHTPGHTPGHICLWDAERRVLLSGDHILGDITPNITVWPGVRDSLGDYLASLEAVRGLGAELALPGHRRPIRDVTGRIEELERHHGARLDELLTLLEDGPHTVCELASRMSWDIQAESWEAFPMAQKWFACGEAASHLEHLERLGRVRRRGEPPRWEAVG